MYDFYMTRDDEQEMKRTQKIIVNNMHDGKKMMNVYDLPGYRTKSTYGRAKVIETKNAVYLMSYTTIVCSITKKTGEFMRHWTDYSKTTMDHINTFRTLNHMNTLNKKTWEAMPVTRA